MAAAPWSRPEALPIAGLRFAVPQAYVLDDLDDRVSASFAAALSRLSEAGARIDDVAFDELGAMAGALRHGGILGAEAWALHRSRLEERGDRVDPRVKVRIERGRNLTAADLIDIHHRRNDMMAHADASSAPLASASS